MSGSGVQGVVLLGVCAALTCALGCGGNTGSNTKSSTGGSSSAGGSTTGGQASADLADQLLSATDDVCKQLAKCYPELQQPGELQCIAPTGGGLHISYQNPAADETAKRVITKCVHEYADQAQLQAWISCQVDASQDTIACFNDCPTDGLACTNAGDDAIAKCEALAPQDTLKTCFEANQ